MASCFAQGRLGTEINNAPLWFLWTTINHTPAGDSLLRGESLQVIIKRIAKLSDSNFKDVENEVKEILKNRIEKEQPQMNEPVKESRKSERYQDRMEQAFLIGTPVKEKNVTWHGYTCGWYKTPEVPEGYVVKSDLNPSEVKTYRVDELVMNWLSWIRAQKGKKNHEL